MDKFPLPHLAGVADDLAMIKSMTSPFAEHTSANYFLHTDPVFKVVRVWEHGLDMDWELKMKTFPGLWFSMEDLIPPGGLDCFGSGFLPATYQGSVFLPSENPIAIVKRTEPSDSLQRNKLDLIRSLDEKTLSHLQGDPQVEAAIRNYETAYLMQSAVPELTDLRGETEATKKLYGLDSTFKNTQTFAKQCLIARRLRGTGGTVHRTYLPGRNETVGISTKILSMGITKTA